MRRGIPFFIAGLLLFACDEPEFDSAKWKNADLSTRTRVELAKRLVNQERLNGMTRQQVVTLLGEPTPTDKWGKWDMIYVLGPTDYMPIDNEWLVIRLDKAGKVSEFEVTED